MMSMDSSFATNIIKINSSIVNDGPTINIANELRGSIDAE